MEAFIRRGLAAVVTAAVHVGAYAVLVPTSAEFRREIPPVLVELIAVRPEPVVPESEPEAPVEAAPSPKIEPSKRAPTMHPATTPVAVANPSPEAPAGPLDLTGITMTAGDGSWTAPVGANPAPVTPAVTTNGKKPVPQIPGQSGPNIVAIETLAKRPVPPNLDAALRQNYPADARRLGLGGQAIVRGRIAPNGRLERAWTVSESTPGFGRACERTILGTTWSPPLDDAGRPVHTEIKYTCRFRIDD